MPPIDSFAGTRIVDSLGAFCPDHQVAVHGSGDGPLAGLSFAVKDVFDVAGSVTGNGHPDWLRTHEPAAETAIAVQRLLGAGADLVGKTIADELCYSLTGENFHYGTPANPEAPDRVPGGSSSGSASAVAGGAVDFALGSDCGGSVRVPASYCGILGMRPTHDRVPLAGAVPFAATFDTVGWFARDPDIFMRIGLVLLADDEPAKGFTRLLWPVDAFEMPEPRLQAALEPVVTRIEALVAPRERAVLADEGLDLWSASFRTVQAAEIWKSVGAWIEEVQPRFGPGVSERFAAAKRVEPAKLERAVAHRGAITNRLGALLTPGTAMVLPTVPRGAPARGTDTADIEVAYRNKAMNLLCIAGLAGLPQLSLPLARDGHLPLGLSIVGPRGSDVDLLSLAVRACST